MQQHPASDGETAAEYIAGKKEDGNRGSDYFLFVKGNQPSLQRAAFDAIQASGPRDPDYTELDHGHGRIIRRSLWAAGADGIDFPACQPRSPGSAATATTATAP